MPLKYFWDKSLNVFINLLLKENVMRNLLFSALIMCCTFVTQNGFSQDNQAGGQPNANASMQNADQSARSNINDRSFRQSDSQNFRQDGNQSFRRDGNFGGQSYGGPSYGGQSYGGPSYGGQSYGGPAYGGGQSFGGGDAGNCCPEDHACADQPVGDCWCLMCHYEPCYYNDWQCCDDTEMCKKRCCRYVPRYYQVQKCRYVPQYYCETKCCQEPEYYDVDYCKPCKKWVCCKKCRYVCKYYYKHTCGDPNCTTPCPTNNCQ